MFTLPIFVTLTRGQINPDMVKIEIPGEHTSKAAYSDLGVRLAPGEARTYTAQIHNDSEMPSRRVLTLFSEVR